MSILSKVIVMNPITLSIIFNIVILIILIIGFLKFKGQGTFKITSSVLLMTAWGFGLYVSETTASPWYFVVMLPFVLGNASATIWHDLNPNTFKFTIIVSAIVLFSVLIYVEN